MILQKQVCTFGGIELDEFRKLCQESLDGIVDYHADLSSRGVLLEVTPVDIRGLFAEEISRGCEGLLANWRDRVVPKLTAVADLRELVSRNIILLDSLHNLVREHPDFEVLHEPVPYLYCFRYLPNGLAARQDEPAVQTFLDCLNQAIVAAVQYHGFNLVTTIHIRSRIAIRMSICSHTTVEEDVNSTFEAIARWGRLLMKAHFVRYEQSQTMEALPCSNESCSSSMEL